MSFKTGYIDLYSSGAGKVNYIVRQKLGGRYSFKDIINVRKGVSGLEFTDEINGVPIRYRVTAELFRQGIGLYFRTYRNNFFLPVPFEEIEIIRIDKSEDVIHPIRFSFYRLMTKIGFNYLISRNFLAANEFSIIHPICVEIIKSDGTKIPLKIRRINPKGIFEFFKQPSLNNLSTFKIE